jgi:hypothetical protein
MAVSRKLQPWQSYNRSETDLLSFPLMRMVATGQHLCVHALVATLTPYSGWQATTVWQLANLMFI